MGDLSRGDEISLIRGGDFEIGANGVSAETSVQVVIEDVTPITLMPLEDDLGLVLGTGSAIFTRATPASGTFTDRNNGVITAAGVDIARFEREGLLMEAASTNICLQSEDFTTTWTTAGSATVTANQATAPDGAFTADRFDGVSASLGNHVRQTFTSSASGKHTFVIFAESEDADEVALRVVEPGQIDQRAEFNLLTGTILAGSQVDSESIEKINGFFRLQVTVTLLTTGAFNIRYGPTGASTTFKSFIWGGKVQAKNFATSYISTTTGSVIRNLDDLSISSSNIPGPTVDYSVCMTADVIGLDSSASQTLFNVDGETSRRIQWNTTTGAIEAIHGAVTSTSTSTFSAGDSVDICFTVGATNQTLYINEVQEDQDAKGTVTGTATAIDIGHQAGANQAFSHIKDLKILDVELTADQVIST